MSVEFRQRTPSEYLRIAWKRKWLIILPAIAIATSVAWVVYRLPDIYESFQVRPLSRRTFARRADGADGRNHAQQYQG